MKWMLYIVVFIALVIGVTFLIGNALPARTTISRSINLQQPRKLSSLFSPMCGDGPFVGSWTYEISPGLEDRTDRSGRVQKPALRVIARIFGQTKYMDEHLEDPAKKFGETATVM